MTQSKMHLIYILGILLLLSCTNNKAEYLPTVSPELAQAESIMYTHPDSALHILESMTPPKTSDKYQHATWCLLLSQAKVKNYKKLGTDSLINIPYKYFHQEENPQRIALAEYLKGIYYNEERHDSEIALSHYLNAAKEIEKTEDYQLAHLIHAEIGTISAYNSIADYAIEEYEEALKFAKLSNNKAYIAASLAFLGRAYSIKPDVDTAIRYYESALKVFKETDDKRSTAAILSELAANYSSGLEEHKKALSYAKEALKIKEGNHWDIETNYLTIGDIYRKLNMNDSAQYYLNKATASDNVYTKRSSYQALFYLNRDIPQNYVKAMQYCDSFYTYLDSVTRIKHNGEIIAMKEKYEHEKLLNEKNTLIIEKEQSTQINLYILLSIIVLVALLIFLYQRKLMQKQQMIQKQEEQLRNYSLQMHDNEMQIEQNSSHIALLSEQLASNEGLQETMVEQQNEMESIIRKNEELKRVNEEMQQHMNAFSHGLQDKLKTQLSSLEHITEENTRLRKRIECLISILIPYIPSLNSLIKKPQSLHEEQWQELEKEMNRVFDNFTVRLSKEVSTLTKIDLQICCFIKLHLTVAKIATILNLSPESVSKRKQRMKEQINNALGVDFDNNQSLDNWIWRY